MITVASRVGATTLQATISERMPQGGIYTTFHHPLSGANVITTENSDWATICPEYKVTAVQMTRANQRSDWQERHQRIEVEHYRVAPAAASAAPGPSPPPCRALGPGAAPGQRCRHGPGSPHCRRREGPCAGGHPAGAGAGLAGW